MRAEGAPRGGLGAFYALAANFAQTGASALIKWAFPSVSRAGWLCSTEDVVLDETAGRGGVGGTYRSSAVGVRDRVTLEMRV